MLDLLREAALLCGGRAPRLVDELARDYPASLAQRPAQLARAAGVRSADVTELVRAAGFDGLDDLRDRAAREQPGARPRRRATTSVATSRPDPDAVARLASAAVTDTLVSARATGVLEAAAGAVLGSRRRWVFGDLRSRGYAQLFTSDLTTALAQVVLVDPSAAGVLAAAADVQARDSLTVFSFRRYSRLTVRLTREFAERGATVVAVTDDTSAPVALVAEHVLRVVAPEPAPAGPAVVALAHALAAATAAGAKGAARRAEHEAAVAESLQWYEDVG
ncbi:MurR/RpiR family transcriptional regulator [Jatrophihabitans fulvus]